MESCSQREGDYLDMRTIGEEGRGDNQIRSDQKPSDLGNSGFSDMVRAEGCLGGE